MRIFSLFHMAGKDKNNGRPVIEWLERNERGKRRKAERGGAIKGRKCRRNRCWRGQSGKRRETN